MRSTGSQLNGTIEVEGRFFAMGVRIAGRFYNV